MKDSGRVGGRRRSVRLKGYDYSQAGVYFVTVCAYGRRCLFGIIFGGQVVLTRHGEVVQTCWEDIPAHFAEAELDVFVVMPNHMHGIVVLAGGQHCRPVGARHAVPEMAGSFGRPMPGSLSSVLRSFKSASAKRANELCRTPSAPIWQRSYYEHVIRDDSELARVREYITTNPLQWDLDRENTGKGVVSCPEDDLFGA
ncbi:MAG: transposase [Chloroflexi bacterium]|nr:transposase [Chloroflexota bacterium]